MEYDTHNKEIIMNKQLNFLDNFVIDFCSNLKEYVLVSGYVSLIFGRSRATEDVDLLVPKMTLENFKRLFHKLITAGYECANSMNPEEAYTMLDDFAIRFFKKGKPIPNMEFKTIKDDIGMFAFENKIKVRINDKELFISPLELQIAYKLFLSADGTKEEILVDKDIEDARYLFKLFEEKIKKGEIIELLDKFKISERIKWLK